MVCCDADLHAGCHRRLPPWGRVGAPTGLSMAPGRSRSSLSRRRPDHASLTAVQSNSFHLLQAIRLIHGRLQALRELDRIVGGYPGSCATSRCCTTSGGRYGLLGVAAAAAVDQQHRDDDDAVDDVPAEFLASASPTGSTAAA